MKTWLRRAAWLLALTGCVLLTDVRAVAETIAVVVVLTFLFQDYGKARNEAHREDIVSAYNSGRTDLQKHFDEMYGPDWEAIKEINSHEEDDSEARRRLN